MKNNNGVYQCSMKTILILIIIMSSPCYGSDNIKHFLASMKYEKWDVSDVSFELLDAKKQLYRIDRLGRPIGRVCSHYEWVSLDLDSQVLPEITKITCGDFSRNPQEGNGYFEIVDRNEIRFWIYNYLNFTQVIKRGFYFYANDAASGFETKHIDRSNILTNEMSALVVSFYSGDRLIIQMKGYLDKSSNFILSGANISYSSDMRNKMIHYLVQKNMPEEQLTDAEVAKAKEEREELKKLLLIDPFKN